MTTTRRSRRISSSSGSLAIEKEDFINGMLAALSNKEVIEKLQTVVVNDLRKEVAYLRCVIEKKDATIESLTKRVDDLEVALDDHEQYSRRNSLRLFGLVESENEDITKRTIDALNESMNPKLSPPLRLEEIDRIHRVGPRDKPSRPVLVKFATYASRRRIYKARVGLNPNPRRPRWDERADASSSVDTDLTGTAGKPHEQSQGTRTQVLFLNEDLTQTRARLLYNCRVAKRKKLINDCWSSDGTILIKNIANKVIVIKTLKELNDNAK